MLFGVKANVGSNPTVTAKGGYYEFPQLVITNSPRAALSGGNSWFGALFGPFLRLVWRDRRVTLYELQMLRCLERVGGHVKDPGALGAPGVVTRECC
jgi:hypothetical protein